MGESWLLMQRGWGKGGEQRRKNSLSNYKPYKACCDVPYESKLKCVTWITLWMREGISLIKLCSVSSNVPRWKIETLPSVVDSFAGLALKNENKTKQFFFPLNETKSKNTTLVVIQSELRSGLTVAEKLCHTWVGFSLSTDLFLCENTQIAALMWALQHAAWWSWQAAQVTEKGMGRRGRRASTLGDKPAPWGHRVEFGKGPGIQSVRSIWSILWACRADIYFSPCC